MGQFIIVVIVHVAIIVYFILRKYPEKRNILEGYRTILSYWNSENWVFSNKYFYRYAKLFFVISLIVLSGHGFVTSSYITSIQIAGIVLAIELGGFFIIMEILLFHRTFLADD